MDPLINSKNHLETQQIILQQPNVFSQVPEPDTIEITIILL